MLADGETFDTIQEELECNRTYITRWNSRVGRGGLASPNVHLHFTPTHSS
jgi:hypothetical protein